LCVRAFTADRTWEIYSYSKWCETWLIFKSVETWELLLHELSYRKQIARQLRTQYVDGINSNLVTLKCGSEVTQGHSSWYHSKAWVASYSQFIVTIAVSLAVCEIFSVKELRDLENWLRGRSRSLKMTPFDRPYTTFYWSAIVSIALSGTVF